MTQFKVITYNLHKGRCRKRRDILAHAVDAIAARDPDLLLCQEVFHGLEEQLEQSRFITTVLGHDHHFGPNAFYDRGCHGNATFARLPMGTSANRNITESFFEKRGILHTRLHAEFGDFEVLNTHFSLTGRQRRRQWRKLCDALPDCDTVPVLAAGDFNDWSGALDRRARLSGRLDNALWALPPRLRRSFPSHRPRFHFDRIYVRGFKVLDVRVLQGDPWAQLSDHLPVEAILEWDPRGKCS